MKRPVPLNLKLKLTFSNSVEPLLNAIFGCTRRPGQVVWSAWTTLTNRAGGNSSLKHFIDDHMDGISADLQNGIFCDSQKMLFSPEICSDPWSAVLGSGKKGQNFAAVLYTYRWPFFSLASAPFLYFIISIYV